MYIDETRDLEENIYMYNHIMGTKIEQCCGSFFVILNLQHFLSLFLMQ